MEAIQEPHVITKEIPEGVEFTLAQAAFEAIKRDFEQPEVREDYQFSTIAFRAIDSKVHKEKQARAKLPLLILDEPVSDSENGCTLLDVITEENLRYVPYGEAHVRPIRPRSEEFSELGHFVADHPQGKCLCFEYDTQVEAKQKSNVLRSFRHSNHFQEVFNLTQKGQRIFITLGERRLTDS